MPVAFSVPRVLLNSAVLANPMVMSVQKSGFSGNVATKVSRWIVPSSSIHLMMRSATTLVKYASGGVTRCTMRACM